MDINYNELFESGENQQGSAAPAEGSENGSGNSADDLVSEILESSTETPERNAKGADSNGKPPLSEGDAVIREEKDKSDADAGTAKKSTSEQSKEERAKYAAARRKAETDAAVFRARSEEREKSKKEMDGFFASAKLKNPFDNNKPISNMDDFRAYKEKFEAARLQKDFRAGKLTQEALEKAVNETPVMKKAAELVERAEKKEREALKARTDAKISEELRQISSLDPSIKKAGDLLKMDSAGEFYELVKKGNSFIDAYRLANFDKLTKTARAAAQQQAINRTASKNHLTGTATRGAGAVTVPSDELALYRELNPGTADSEIQKHYNRYIKK